MSSIKWGNNSASLGVSLGGLGAVMYTKHFAHCKGSLKLRFYFLVIIGVFVVILGIGYMGPGKKI